MASYMASASQLVNPNSPQESAILPTPAGSSVGGPGSGPGAGGEGPDRPASTPHSQQPQHKRVYQACIPCRRRKVRCDLGSVDDPHDPPCVRCRRESKECYFSATRRKRKADDPDDREVDDYIVRNGRKRTVHAQESSPVQPSPLDSRLYSEVPLTPGGSASRSQPLRRPDNRPGSGSGSGPAHRTDGSSEAEPNSQLENREAQTVMRRGLYGPHDALDLLYKAATDNSNQPPLKHEMSNGSAGGLRSAGGPEGRMMPGLTQPGHPPHSLQPRPVRPHQSHQVNQQAPNSGHVDQHHRVYPQPQPAPPVDPELSNRNFTEGDKAGYAEALKAWSRFRFVRAGWFTPQEGIEYIDYYYEYLSPLTPISPPTFRSPATHLTLLTEEPILTVTLLTISSRYRRLPGTGGHCRSYAIHEQLWSYLQGMIERCFWGQEAFGANLPMSVDDFQSSTTAPWRGLRKGSLRTLGTIESFMILTEWHPRALHFPPAEAIDELMLPSYDANDRHGIYEDDHGAAGAGPGNSQSRPIESWLEPAWRSDRMCWMLLSTAMGLAYELGVFDDIDNLLASGCITRPEYEDETYRHRAFRIKRLLLIYHTQLAGRLGWTSMVPEHLRKTDPAVSRRRPVSTEGTTPGTNPSSMSNSFNYIPDLELDDQIIHCWAGISHAMHMGNEKLFQSRQHTTDIIQSGKYTALLDEFRPILKDWNSEFNRFRMPPFIRCILTIEYQYVRIYVNSLSLQAVVERCASNAGGTVQGGSSGTGIAAPQLSPQSQHYYGKLPLGQLGGFSNVDQECIQEVVEGSRSLLKTVVDGLLPGNYLKHAPVRTYFRIISGAMFLLKTFALGATKSDVEVSIGLMDQTVEALRTCVVDDVHLGIRFADLLDSLTSRLRNRFINVLPGGQEEGSTGGEGSSGAGAGAGGQGQNGQHTGGVGDVSSLWPGQAGRALERAATPNISATPFELISSTLPYPSGATSGMAPSTPAASGAAADPNNANAHNGNGNGNPNNPNNPAGPTVPGPMHPMEGPFDSIDWSNNGEMWYLPTGPAFFQNMENSAVSMTAEGVNVGGVDLLDYMAMDPIEAVQVPGPGHGGGQDGDAGGGFMGG